MTTAWVLATLLAVVSDAVAAPIEDRVAELTRDLSVTPPEGDARDHLDLQAAQAWLAIPSVSVAIIDGGELAWAGVFGAGSTHLLFQAASLSKFVTAVGALRLVQQGRVGLDTDVDASLISWRVPPSDLTRNDPVTLRGLLDMTAGIGPAGYLGYAPGEKLPNLQQILDGAPPSNAPAVSVQARPGSRYAYSGGGYEIVQALIEDATGKNFPAAMEALVLRPAGMADSQFTQPLPDALGERAATGHDARGRELPGGWRVVPELAAGGLWSTPTDLGRLLIAVLRAWRGEDASLLDQRTARQMISRQGVGPYGLGAAIAGEGHNLALMKRGQNVGYQGYLLLFPATGQGIVIMTGSDNGTTLATALIRRAAAVFGWPPLDELYD